MKNLFPYFSKNEINKLIPFLVFGNIRNLNEN